MAELYDQFFELAAKLKIADDKLEEWVELKVKAHKSEETKKNKSLEEKEQRERQLEKEERERQLEKE